MCATIERIVQPGWICADLGANIGFFTLLLARLVGPTGRVIAFEAHPSNAELVSRNVRNNGYSSRAKVENIAVSDGSKEKVELYPGRKNESTGEWSMGEWNIVGCDVLGQAKEPAMVVAACSLDNYFPPGSRLDLVKMDIEGAEALALVGMRRILREARPILLIEFHSDEGWAGRQELHAAGYRLYDMEQREIDPIRDTQRLYHVIATPMTLESTALC